MRYNIEKYNLMGIGVMEAKCPKCESIDFSIVKREDKLFCMLHVKNAER